MRSCDILNFKKEWMMIKRLFLLLSAIFVMAVFIPGRFPSTAAWGKVPEAHTPTSGSVERRAILDAMRLKVKELQELDVVFVVKWMKVSDGWAWVHTLPRSKDGSSTYEDVYGLLHSVQGRWEVVELPCTEPENPDCVESPGYFSKLAVRFPEVPRGILPAGSVDR